MKKILSTVALATMLFGLQAQTQIKTYDACDANLNDVVNVGDAEYVAKQVLTQSAGPNVVTAEDLNALLQSIDQRLAALEKEHGISHPDSPGTPAATASFEFSSKTLHVGETFTQELSTTSDGSPSYLSTNPSVATVDALSGKVTAVANGETTIIASVAATASYPAVSAAYTIRVEAQNMNNGHEYVDLGVVVDGKPVYWAKTNIGAEKPADYGDYYAWGETETKAKYSQDTYQYYQYFEGEEDADGIITDGGWRYVDIGKDISGTEYDVAHIKWQGDWRMPTKAEQYALRSQCTWTWVQMRNTKGDTVNGYKVSNKTDSSKFIFLPAAGYRDSGSPDYAGSNGYYWSSSLNSGNSAFCLYFNSGSQSTNTAFGRFCGQSVRPVCQ